MSKIPLHDQPLAAEGLVSYRAKGPYGWIMIGARDDTEAWREAMRSTSAPQALEVWSGDRYVSVD
jgi:hypothetical protein